MNQQFSLSLSLLCRVMEVSRSGYQAWLRHEQGPRARQTALLDQAIEDAFESKRQAYGSPRMVVEY